MEKSAYICGPLTELPKAEQEKVKSFYATLADVIGEVMGVRAFVPHEHYDPIKHANYIPQEIDAAEREQVCSATSLLLVVAIGPSWGGGIEVEMANQNDVPVVILCERAKLEERKISRLLRGNPAVVKILPTIPKSMPLRNCEWSCRNCAICVLLYKRRKVNQVCGPKGHRLFL